MTGFGADRHERPPRRQAVLNPISIMADRLGDYLSELYLQYFSHRNPEYATYMGGAARLVLERIGNSNALYHNIEHTLMVTLVGQQIIRGRLLSESLTPGGLAALYLRAACPRHRHGARRVPGRHLRQHRHQRGRHLFHATARRLRRGACAVSYRPRQDLCAPEVWLLEVRRRGAHRPRDRDDALSGAERPGLSGDQDGGAHWSGPPT